MIKLIEHIDYHSKTLIGLVRSTDALLTGPIVTYYSMLDNRTTQHTKSNSIYSLDSICIVVNNINLWKLWFDINCTYKKISYMVSIHNNMMLSGTVINKNMMLSGAVINNHRNNLKIDIIVTDLEPNVYISNYIKTVGCYFNGYEFKYTKGDLTKSTTDDDEIEIICDYPIDSIYRDALYNRDLDTISSLLKNGLDPNTHLGLAVMCEYGYFDIADIILQYKPNTNLYECNNIAYNPPLISSIMAKNMQFTEKLLKLSANPNTPQAPLIIACQQNNVALVKQLLDYGANIDQVNTKTFFNRYSTALHWAYKLGYDEIIHILVDRNARLDLKNEYNKIPSQLDNKATSLLC